MNLTNQSGKICPYCQSSIKHGDDVKVCNECHQPHHYDCWMENEGCTTYGCVCGPAMGPSTGTIGSYAEASPVGGETHPDNFQSYDGGYVPVSPETTREGISQIRGWNWGAFLLAPLWVFMMGCPGWGLLMIVGVVVFPTPVFKALFYISISLILGALGNELSWKSRKWRGIDHFRRTQNAWKTWAIHSWIIGAYIGYRVYIEIIRAS